MEELDFSEEACIGRYVRFVYFDEDFEEYLTIQGIQEDDPVISGLQTYGRIVADWDGYDSRKTTDTVGQMGQRRLAA